MISQRLFSDAKPSVIWLTLVSVLSALPLAMRFGSAIWFGMLAPLVVTCTSWMLTEHWFKRGPARLTSVMMTAFAGKLVFFAVYVGSVVGVLDVPPVPFVVSFTGYYIVLHMLEALWLKRLLVS
jgi:hypothetical protein